MTKHWKRKLALSLAICSLPLSLTAYAASDATEFSLEETVVTAMRYETKNLDTPADVTAISQEKLKSTGASNLIEALKYTEGITYYAYGPHGQSWGGMNSKLTIRGIEGGTLVLINGVTANLNGVYHLDQIPVDAVERVEIIKGGGSVLYGSEAFGGVINIITKKKVENTISVSSGSDQQSYALSLQAGKSSFYYNYSKVKESEPFSDTLNPNSYKPLWRNNTPVYFKDVFGDSVQNDFTWNCQFDDNLSLMYMYNKNDYSLLYKENGTGSVLNNYHYNDQKNRLQLEYKKDNWTSKAYYNRQQMDSTTVETARPNLVAWGKEVVATYGLDTQKVWQAGNAKLLGGFTFQNETYEKQAQALGPNSGATALNRYLKPEEYTGPYKRGHYSLYGQWDKPVSDKTRIILSAREDKVKPDTGTSYDAFCPQFQTITKINDHSSWYTNVGKSFRMPTFTQLYMSTTSSFTNNPDLKPEHGMNYEAGYKLDNGSDNWKIALFRTEVKDKIGWKTVTLADGSTPQQATNLASFKNEGVELSYGRKLSDKFSFTIGGSYGNPQAQATSSSPWWRTSGRTQLSSSLIYTAGPTTAAISATYFGDRMEYDKTAGNYRKLSPMIPVSLHVSHDLSKTYTVTFDVDNLLDRNDYSVSGGSGSIYCYYFQPRTYKLGVTARF